MFDKQQLECKVWDLYKEAYGKRPSHLDLSKMSLAQLTKLTAMLKEVAQLRKQPT